MSAAVGRGWQPVYRAVRRIPAGRVATYGQVAALAGMPGAARQVGWALAALGEDDDVPWHRVLNARGEISPRGERETVDLQRALLESEGIEMSRGGRVDLKRYAWATGSTKTASNAKPRSGSAERSSGKPARKPRKNGGSRA